MMIITPIHSTYVEITRDPFARITIIRRVVKAQYSNSEKGCQWCGGMRAKGNLFQYGIETDNRRILWDVHAYCSKSCRDIHCI